MTKLAELLERRSALIATMKTHEADGGEAFDNAKSELGNVTGQIERARAVENAERQERGNPISGDPKLSTELRSNFSLVRALAMQAGLSGHDYGFEREVQPELAKRAGKAAEGVMAPLELFLEKRVLTSTLPVGGPGANLVQTELNGELYFDRLRAAMKVQSLGARILNGLVGNVDIPGLKTSSTVGWVAENAALTSSDPEYRKVSMTPKHAGAITEVSRNMLQQVSPDIETLIRADFAALLADAVDRAAIFGTGTGAQPRGILSTAGIGTVAMGTNGLAMTVDTPADVMCRIDIANAPATSRGFLTNSKVMGAAMKLKDSEGRPYGLQQVFQNQRVEFSNNVPSNLTKGTGTNLSALIYGNWDDLLIGYWSAFDLLVNPYEATAYAKGNVSIRAMLTCDVNVRYAESFAAATDIVA
ncbi:phage major capsid protein [Sphingorhabdus sp.]|jgi:HK97 family phage major capsid protein|uniref:phage major capsid protein n=1 Tax=Sphingorhabdus sp. TaxID=1902408 RepID=UPI0037CB228F